MFQKNETRKKKKELCQNDLIFTKIFVLYFKSLCVKMTRYSQKLLGYIKWKKCSNTRK